MGKLSFYEIDFQINAKNAICTECGISNDYILSMLNNFQTDIFSFFLNVMQ